MRYPAAEKLEIIRLVEQSPLPVRHTLAKLGIPRAVEPWRSAGFERPPAVVSAGLRSRPTSAI
jgi:hypothetical protein